MSGFSELRQALIDLRAKHVEKIKVFESKAPEYFRLHMLITNQTVKIFQHIHLSFSNPVYNVKLTVRELWLASNNGRRGLPRVGNVAGSVVYNKEDNGFYCWDGAQWCHFANLPKSN